MNFSDTFKTWKEDKIFSEKQAEYLENISFGPLTSLSSNLHLIFYLGVLITISSIGILAKEYYQQIGPVLIAALLTAIVIVLGFYCFKKAQPFSRAQTPSPNMAFDYILFAASSLLIVDVTFIESQFHLLGDNWFYYLLMGFSLFTIFAYRFDNRLVLTMALTKLTSFFAALIERFSLPEGSFHIAGLIMAILFFAIGAFSLKQEIKKHFHGVWWMWALHLGLASLVYGCINNTLPGVYFMALLGVSIAIMVLSLAKTKISYVMFAGFYLYVGFTGFIRPWNYSSGAATGLYFLGSSAGLMVWIVWLIKAARKKGVAV